MSLFSSAILVRPQLFIGSGQLSAPGSPSGTLVPILHGPGPVRTPRSLYLVSFVLDLR